VLAVASDPRSGDVRALLTRGIPGGAEEVLFRDRPLGSLAAALPVPVGDGRTASVGEVAATAGAIAAGGMRYDLRSVSRVERPDPSGGKPEVLDAAKALPAGTRILPAERATSTTEEFRAAARLPGPAGTRLPFALAGVSGSAGSDSWHVGCVPELCLTVWVGPQGPSNPTPTTAAPGDPATAVLARQLVTGTFARYLELAPGRVSVPELPDPPAPASAVAEPGNRHPAVETSVAPEPTPSATPEPTKAPRSAAEPSPGPTVVGVPPASASPTASPAPSDPGSEPGSDDGGKAGGGGRPVADGNAVLIQPGGRP
jgi:membrane peptidoglycan carboxypeptidase